MKLQNANKINRIIALAVSVCVISVFLLSAGFVFELVEHYGNHEHVNTEHTPNPADNHCSKCCVTCLVNSGVSGLIKYSDVIFAVILAVLALFTVLSFKSVLQTGFPTLVSLKLRMNN